MVIQTNEELTSKVKSLKEQRKNGDLSLKEYYRELLVVLQNLAESLIDEQDHLDESQIRPQIPLMVVLLDDQIAAFTGRD